MVAIPLGIVGIVILLILVLLAIGYTGIVNDKKLKKSKPHLFVIVLAIIMLAILLLFINPLIALLLICQTGTIWLSGIVIAVALNIAIMVLVYKYVIHEKVRLGVTISFGILVLLEVFFLSAFSFCPAVSSPCIAEPGFLCQRPVLGTNGNLSFTFGESTGVAKIYNVGMACTATQNRTGLPNPPIAMVYLSPNGTATTALANGPGVGALNLLSGEMITVTGLKCFGSIVPIEALTNLTIGSSYTGLLWINYTTNKGMPGPSNPIMTTRFATIYVKVT